MGFPESPTSMASTQGVSKIGTAIEQRIEGLERRIADLEQRINRNQQVFKVPRS